MALFLSLFTFGMGTLLTGLSGGILMLILFRSVATGVGEAFYYPAANALIGQYHQNTRAQAMAVHQTALYIGIVASSCFAGWVGELHGWRTTFYAFGTLGVLLAGVVAWRLRNEHHDATWAQPVSQPAEPPVTLWEVLRAILHTPTLNSLSLARQSEHRSFVAGVRLFPLLDGDLYGAEAALRKGLLSREDAAHRASLSPCGRSL